MNIVDPAIKPDFQRDRWGRPLVIPAGTTTPEPYTRASSAAKTIEDTYNLEMWARRNVVFGMAHDASLVARTLAVGGTPTTWNKGTKSAVNKIAQDAATVAAAHKAADIGTAVHALTEQLDLGAPVTGGPYQADLDAYRDATRAAGLTIHPEHVECRMVCDTLRLAGTADRLVELDGRLIVADLKTSASVEFGGLGWSAQLAAYAHSDIYNPAYHARQTLDIEKAWGIIIHLPAGTGTCTLYRVDLTAGYAAAVLANQVRATREQSKKWITPLNLARPTDRRTALLARYDRLDDTGKARFRAANVNRDDLDAIEHTLDTIAAATPDEGGDAHPAEIEQLRQQFDLLDQRSRNLIGSIVKDADAAGVPFLLKDRRSARRHGLYLGLVTLARHGHVDNDELIRELAATILGTDTAFTPTMTVGCALGGMNADQAATFAATCQQLVDDITSVDLRHRPAA